MTDIPFPSARRNPLIEVFYLHDHLPFICGANGHIGGDILEVIERDLIEYPELMIKGDGTYLFEANWVEAQVGEEGRAELPAYWDLTLVRFESIEPDHRGIREMTTMCDSSSLCL